MSSFVNIWDPQLNPSLFAHLQNAIVSIQSRFSWPLIGGWL